MDREGGSVALDSLVSIILVLLLSLGLIQVALTLYGRNIVLSAAHEGARTAAELGRDASAAQTVALRTVQRSAGGLVRGLRVTTEISGRQPETVWVEVRASVGSFGPVPLSIPIHARAAARRDVVVP